MNRSDLMVSPGGPLHWEEPLSGRRAIPVPRTWWVLLAPLVAGLVAFASFVELPYYSISPGLAREVNDLVTVEQGPMHPPDGKVLFTTVTLSRVTLFEALGGWIDDDVTVLEEEVLFPPAVGDPRQFNLALMADSKQTAITVALEHLGYSVTEHGEGAAVVAVQAGSPAEYALEVNDVIARVDDHPVETSDQVVEIIQAHAPFDTVSLTVHNLVTDEVREVPVRLADNGEGKGFLGVSLVTNRPRFDLPFDVGIDSGSIGGPSAGLAFTLAVLDALTPGELTGGEQVAVTGTINADGTVGPVGGVAQKAAAVRRSGAVVFLVPASEADEARKRANGAFRVEPIEHLHDALAVLAGLGGNALDLERVDGQLALVPPAVSG